MRIFIAALLFAINYAQTVNGGDGGSSSNHQTQCTFSNGEAVDSGYSGEGKGDQHCNHCACVNGILMCTLLDCPEVTVPPASTAGCTLTAGEQVVEGWQGKDSDWNFCNDCICHRNKLMCTREVCEPMVPAQADNHHFIPQQTPIVPGSVSPISPLLPDLDKSTCGGKTQNMCHGLGAIQCAEEACCVLQGAQCNSITKAVRPTAGMECGDFQETGCRKETACMWNELELECEDLKEMDCQDLKKEHCWAALTCSWVFDEVRETCMETKEMETAPAGHLTVIPPTTKGGKFGTQLLQHSHPDAPYDSWLIWMVIGGSLFGCIFGILIHNCLMHKDRSELTEDLTLGGVHRRI